MSDIIINVEYPNAITVSEISENNYNITIEQPGSIAVNWGDIEGTLSDQTDLQTEIDTKLDKTLVAGGTTGQVLSKLSGDNYDFEWANQTGGGTTNHSDLDELDYASSGHTGFQSSLGFTPENVSNKVSSFQVTPDNTHYPSEKLVKDSLDGKQASLGFTPANQTTTISGAGLLDTQGGDLSTNRTFTLNNSDIDHNGLTNTHNLSTDIDHDGLTNTHNLTTDIDHDSITNTHNLTTDIDHDGLTNTHNLSTDIDHDGLTNTHNLTTDIDHASITNTHNLLITLGLVNPTTVLGAESSLVSWTSPFSGTIIKWYLDSDTSTTAVVDVWKKAGARPTNSDSITASAKPSLTTASHNSSITLTNWITAITAGDVFVFEVESNNNAKAITLVLEVSL